MILAALRLWQSMDKTQIDEEIIWIAENDRDTILSDEEIDLLCETLNGVAAPLPAPGPDKPGEQDAIQALVDRHADGNLWGEHADYDRTDWQYEVSNGDTSLGYWEWVLHKVEDARFDAESDAEAERLENAQVRPQHVLSTMLSLGDGSKVPLYLTNACTEHAHDDPDLFRKHSLEWSTNGEGIFYPLTKAEEELVREDVVGLPNGFAYMMGYSCLYKGRKFVMPCAEYYFGEDGDRNQALAEVTAYAADIRPRIEAIEGYVLVDEDDGPDEDRHTVQVLVPFEHALRLVRGANPTSAASVEWKFFRGPWRFWIELTWLNCA
jgi:hypothetical protein